MNILSRKKRRFLRIALEEERILREKSWVSTNAVISDYPLKNEIILWFVVLDLFFFFFCYKYFVIDSCVVLCVLGF